MSTWEETWKTPESLEQEALACERRDSHPVMKAINLRHAESCRRAAGDLATWLEVTDARWASSYKVRVPYSLNDAYKLAGVVSLPPDQLEKLGREKACEFIEGGLLNIRRERMNREAAIDLSEKLQASQSPQEPAVTQSQSMILKVLRQLGPV